MTPLGSIYLGNSLAPDNLGPGALSLDGGINIFTNKLATHYIPTGAPFQHSIVIGDSSITHHIGAGNNGIEIGANWGHREDDTYGPLVTTRNGWQLSMYTDPGFGDVLLSHNGTNMLTVAADTGVVTANGSGLHHLTLSISGTNATPPINTSNIVAWANVTLPDGSVWKTPLYK